MSSASSLAPSSAAAASVTTSATPAASRRGRAYWDREKKMVCYMPVDDAPVESSSVEPPVVELVSEPLRLEAFDGRTEPSAEVVEPEPEPEQQQQQQQQPPPRVIFVVPYRDRAQQRAFFQRHMLFNVLADAAPGWCQVWFVHQVDAAGDGAPTPARRFNRGAMKNLGVRIAQDLYPEHWRDITFVFNDVDTAPFTAGFFDYETRHGTVKHFYGFQFALGGIVSMTGADFDLVGGFPNLWAWGYEDNALQDRCLAHGLRIDRSQFFPFMDKNVMQFPDSRTRQLNRSEVDRYKAGTTDGMYDVFGIVYHELAPWDAAAASGAPAPPGLELLPGARQFQVTDFATAVPEPPPRTDTLLVLGAFDTPILAAAAAASAAAAAADAQKRQRPLGGAPAVVRGVMGEVLGGSLKRGRSWAF